MNLSIRRVFTVTLKSFLAIFGLLVLVIVGLLAYMELKSQPPGSPPPGYEDRLKYDLDNIPGSYSSRKVPVDLWFGRRDGRYDTTHLRIDSDYFSLLPHYHGEAAHIDTIWPSLLSTHEYGKVQKMAGMPYERDKELTLIISETRSGFGTDEYGTRSAYHCEPVIRDEARGVKYCHENHFDEDQNKRGINYWPLDESIQTPLFNNPPRFSCYIVDHNDGRQFNACTNYFSYNMDVKIIMTFVPEQLAIDILTDFPRLIEFLNTLEVKP